MIKRIELAPADVAAGAVEDSWAARAELLAGAPAGVRPVRATVSTAVDGGQRHAGAGSWWFEDADHLAAFDRWCEVDGRELVEGRARLDGSTVVVAEEHVVRGAVWLDARWRDGGPAFKHVALATRAAGLTPAEFSRRWRAHAGQARGSAGPARPIPDDVRGLAYVQNHPLASGRGWAYDAVNEVWFDDLAGLRRRDGWFRAAVGDTADPELFGAHAFLLVREVVVPGR